MASIRHFPMFYRVAKEPGASRWQTIRKVLIVGYGINPRIKRVWQIDKLIVMLCARPEITPDRNRRFVFGVWWRTS